MNSRLLLLVAVLVSGVLSYFSGSMNSYYVQILTFIGINIILGVSLNLINGHTGQFSLGHAGFMAVGGYSAAKLTLILQPQLPPWTQPMIFILGLALGGFMAALAGLAVGVPTLRLRGDYLAIVTLGFGEIIRVILQNTEFLGAATGLTGIPNWTNFGWAWSLAAITVFVIASLVNST